MPASLAERIALRPLVGLAFTEARRAHSGQVDKIGDPYVGHVVRVAERVARWGAPDEVVVAALLHDVIEDTDRDADYLRRGFPEVVVAAVLALTHGAHEPRADYYVRVKANPLALAVKAADIADNSDPRRLNRIADHDTRVRLTHKYIDATAALGLCAYPHDPDGAHSHDDCIDALVTEAAEYAATAGL